MAGILKAKKRTFFTLTFLGSLIWCYVLVFVGIKMGENFETLKSVWHKFDAIILSIITVLGIIYIYKHIKNLKES